MFTNVYSCTNMVLSVSPYKSEIMFAVLHSNVIPYLNALFVTWMEVFFLFYQKLPQMKMLSETTSAA